MPGILADLQVSNVFGLECLRVLLLYYCYTMVLVLIVSIFQTDVFVGK